jgi:hypothetical protein
VLALDTKALVENLPFPDLNRFLRRYCSMGHGIETFAQSKGSRDDTTTSPRGQRGLGLKPPLTGAEYS